MQWIAVVETTPEGRMAVYQPCDTEAEALAHVEKYGGFVAKTPGGSPPAWRADGRRLRQDPLPPFVPPPDPVAEMALELKEIREELARLKRKHK